MKRSTVERNSTGFSRAAAGPGARGGRLVILSQTLFQFLCTKDPPHETASSGLPRWANIAAILSLLVALVPLLPAVRQLLAHNGRDGPPSPGALRIIYPINGSIVGDSVDLSGLTPFPRRHHYLLVTPRLGGPFLQDQPMQVSKTGVLTGRAVLGTQAVGAGQAYTIQILATNAELRSLSTSRLADAFYSEAITVTRKPRGY